MDVEKPESPPPLEDEESEDEGDPEDEDESEPPDEAPEDRSLDGPDDDVSADAFFL